MALRRGARDGVLHQRLHSLLLKDGPWRPWPIRHASLVLQPRDRPRICWKRLPEALSLPLRQDVLIDR